jgi:hypothetical protein
MHTPHLQAFADDLVTTYRIAMTRVPSTDFVQLRRRVEAASALATRAYCDCDSIAWEITQVIAWRLQRMNTLRPTDPGDVLVLDALYRIEESTIARTEPPRGLTPREFCEVLARDVAAHSSADSGLIAAMQSGQFSVNDWRFLGYQWLSTAVDFSRLIAVASLPLPRRQAGVLYANLFDEAGRGDPTRSHFNLLCKFLHRFDIETNDEDVMLDWTVPEVLAMTNTQHRLAWHPEPGWTLGSIFLGERLVPSELSRVHDALVRSELAQGSLEFFEEHVELDVEHSNDWLSLIEHLISDDESQRITYMAAMQRGRAQRLAWDAALEGWKSWKATGIRPHLPFRELREAAGV